ncbi:MAG: ABC transporter ATP-binding protein, partial [Planctomycetes bacterium]|nr:ABC transporter ATP-binding protein [Planctomycetota bacterium]
MLTGTGLRLIYRDGAAEVRAVDGVDVEVREREFVGIVGPSGSGKSSLLYLLAGLKRPTEGRVTFRDRELASMGTNDLASLRRRHFGFVFQNHFLIPYLTGIENVLAGGAALERTEALLGELNIAHVGEKFPYQMSAGERQRVAIARAIGHGPDVLFADEPTASLDRPNAEIVVEHLRRTAERGTLFVVTHDETILKGAGRVLRMFGG